MDVKKLASIPPGGGWRRHGRGDAPTPGAEVGYRYLHSALDDRSRLVYSEILHDERGQTAADFWRRAERWFADWGIACERVLTDNGPCYRSRAWHRACQRTTTKAKKTRPYRPQTNGKIERFHRTLLQEWAYIRPREAKTNAPTPTGASSTTTITTEPTERSAGTPQPPPSGTTSPYSTARSCLIHAAPVPHQVGKRKARPPRGPGQLWQV